MHLARAEPLRYSVPIRRVEQEGARNDLPGGLVRARAVRGTRGAEPGVVKKRGIEIPASNLEPVRSARQRALVSAPTACQSRGVRYALRLSPLAPRSTAASMVVSE